MKTDKIDFDEVLKEMQSQKNMSADVVLMSDYVDIKGQKVSVCKHTPGHIGRYHTHEFFEINYVQKGNCINLVEDDNILMNEGDMIIIHPGAFHNLYTSPECIVYNFLVDKKWLCSELSSLILRDGPVFDFLNSSGNEDFYKYLVYVDRNTKSCVKQAAETVIEYSKASVACKYLLVESAVLVCLSELCENQDNTYLSFGRGKSSHIMIDMLSYIAENCATVDLDQMSERYYYSKTHICRLFLKNTKKSFNNTLMDMKIGRACSMLENTNMTVEEIAHAVGYDSLEYFYRLFKRKMGVTPKEFKKKRQ